MNVVHNAKRNMVFGFINKFIVMLCPFVERTMLIRILGSQYLGLGSLFGSILSVLSLSELGFGSAILYHMYKPVAEGDDETVNALLNLYRKAYRIIGIVILIIGLVIIPFLPHLIKGSYPSDVNLWTLYLIYLANTVISYFMFAYRSSILTVYQREDVNSLRNTIVTLVLTTAKVIVLIEFKSYYYFALLIPIFTVINNLWIAKAVKKYFPQYHAKGTLPKEKIKEIKKLVAGSFIQKACGTTRNSLDSICISALLGLSLTAIYNNYFSLLTALTGILTILANSFMGGIGNHIAVKTAEENFNELKKLDFVYLGISGWFTTCLMCLYQPFMELWMGKEMMLPLPAVVLFCLYFYLLKMGDMRYVYASACGVFWEQRYAAIAETVGNLVLNIVLGYFWGIYGIIIATIISLFFLNFMYKSKIVFNFYFGKEKIKEYYRYQGTYFVITLAICLITYFVIHYINLNQIVLTLIVRGLICLVLPVGLYLLIYFKNPNFKFAIQRIRKK